MNCVLKAYKATCKGKLSVSCEAWCNRVTIECGDCIYMWRMWCVIRYYCTAERTVRTYDATLVLILVSSNWFHPGCPWLDAFGFWLVEINCCCQFGWIELRNWRSPFWVLDFFFLESFFFPEEKQGIFMHKICSFWQSMETIFRSDPYVTRKFSRKKGLWFYIDNNTIMYNILQCSSRLYFTIHHITLRYN